MAEDYQEALREFGLSDNEITIYITLLKLGESSVHDIAKNAGVPRTTSYHLLEMLSQKGLVSNIVKETKKFFQATRPEMIIEKLDAKKNRLMDVIPKINSIAGSINEKPGVQVYEGVRGVRTVLDDALANSKEILLYGDLKPFMSALGHNFPQFIMKRTEKKIPIKILSRKDPYDDVLLLTAKKDYRDFAFLPDEYEIKSNVLIYEDKVAVLSLTQEPFYGIIINDRDFNQSQRQLFEMLWSKFKK